MKIYEKIWYEKIIEVIKVIKIIKIIKIIWIKNKKYILRKILDI